MPDSLHALSSLDGRYAEAIAPLVEFFSEFAYLRDRARVELDFLSAISKIGLTRPMTVSESAQLESIKTEFSDVDAKLIQEQERKTRHDVKAIEYFLRDKLKDTSLADLLPWIHFGLTSEDINNIGQAIALRNSRDQVLLPALDDLLGVLKKISISYKALPMLARTHGQPAVPTTLGKEMVVYFVRLRKIRHAIAKFGFEGKLSGAVGNFNALQYAAPQIDWLTFSSEFVSQFGLRPNLFTTQILPYDNWVSYFDLIRLANSILIDFSQDIWRYISDGSLKQTAVEGEVGSSTMPQKVNPIDFENAEGNLGVANSLFVHYAQKLTTSRLQRDLSDSTVRRTFGTAFGHTLLAWVNLQNGISRVAADEERLRQELDSHWEVVAEGAQTLLRAAGHNDAYEALKQATRGRVLTEDDYKLWLEGLDVDPATRLRLVDLSPGAYLGLSIELVDRATREDN